MPNFYDNLTAEDVATLDRLSMLLIDLRESRDKLLQRHASASIEGLLEKIRARDVDEHAAYEDYLGAKIIEATREEIRSGLRDYMLQIKRVDPA